MLALALAMAAAARPARANGRFPAAQYVLIGPGSQNSTIVLRTTFGLMVSRDGGASFHWECEEALQYTGQWDPALALSADGTISAGLIDGVVQTRDDCEYDRNASAGSMLISDLSNSADGSRIWGVEGADGVPNHVLSSSNGGVSFEILGAGVANVWPLTIDAAPSKPTRLYVTALDDTTREPRLLRSDDGGVTLYPLAPDFMGAVDAYLAGVDPTNADRLWIRANSGPNTLLLRSDDGGASVRLAAMTTGPMLGFALSDDGQRVWYGGATDGVVRSDDGGQTFHRVADTHVSCMRYHGGALYMCADWLSEPYALYRWTDGAPAPEGIFRLDHAVGPAACAPGTVEHDTCGSRWPTVQAMVTPRARDGGADGGPVGDGQSVDVVGRGDVGGGSVAADADGSIAPRPGSCACEAAGAGRRGVPAAMFHGFGAALLAALLGRRRR
jgi:hypothetical protein